MRSVFVILLVVMLGLVINHLQACSRHHLGVSNQQEIEIPIGQRIYKNRCGSCHEAYPPYAYSDYEWPDILSRMQGQANLSDKELQTVFNWLIKNNN